jgi:hypothetical protein
MDQTKVAKKILEKTKARKLMKSGKAQMSGRCRECFTRAESEEIEGEGK